MRCYKNIYFTFGEFAKAIRVPQFAKTISGSVEQRREYICMCAMCMHRVEG